MSGTCLRDPEIGSQRPPPADKLAGSEAAEEVNALKTVPGVPESSAQDTSSQPGAIQFTWRSGPSLVLKCSGFLRDVRDFPSVDAVWSRIEAHRDSPLEVQIDCTRVQSWDSRLPAFVVHMKARCESRGISLSIQGLPPGVDTLVKLAGAQAPDRASERQADKGSLFFQLGQTTLNLWQALLRLSAFCLRVNRAFFKLMLGTVRFRTQELPGLLHECGSQALPIVSLISLLVGLILAFVGAVQLKAFGAQVYVADLVGIAMVREMGAIMTGIIMAGRTGAAFAAQLGTMNVNEEIDALQTMGISPVDFLVLPRMLVLIFMMPLLCLYADLMGIVGGAIVGVGLFDISVVQYLSQTKGAVTLPNIWLGLIKSLVFGMIIAVAGCYQGMYSGRNAQAVGLATTSAVVTAIVIIIAVDGFFAVLCHRIGL